MNCSDAEVLIHALLDGELDAGHTRDVEAHLARCENCAGKLAAYRAMRQAMADANLKEAAPAHLRRRVEAALPAVPAAQNVTRLDSRRRPNRRSFVGGFAVGAVLSAAVAASLVLVVTRDDEDHRLAGEVVSAHLRSLQPGHLTDVETSDQHTVKPWFNGRLAEAPRVIDLAKDDFPLAGGRVDVVDRAPAATLVYRHRKHLISLVEVPAHGRADAAPVRGVSEGYNIVHWTEGGVTYWAVSDIGAGDLEEFVQKFRAAPADQ